MHLFKVTILGGLTAGAVFAESQFTCGGASTVYVTVTATSQAVQTIQAAPGVPSPPPKIGSSIAAALVDTSTDITGTFTNFETITNLLSLMPAAASSVNADQGPYSFAEHDGTTTWLGGKTPPASQSIVTKTKAITVEPIPTGTDAASADAPTTTSYSTLSLITVTSELFTETVIESSLTPVASAKRFTGLGTDGWNSTLTTLVKVAAGAKSSGYPHLPKITHERGSVVGTSHYVRVSYATGEASGTLAERQVGSIVTATIGGVVVSWTNGYDGSVPTSTSAMAASSISVINAIAPTTPTTTVAVYPWDPSPYSEPVHSTKPNAPATPTLSQSSSLVTIETQTPTSTSTVEIIPATMSIPPSSSPVHISESAQSTVSQSSHSSILTPILSTSSIFPNLDPQPGVPILQPTFVPSLISHLPHPTVVTTSNGASIAPFANTSSASRASAAPTSSCSDSAQLTINFDDLPHFSTGPDNVDIPPIFNPYQKLYWEEHFGYVPPPTDPFPPVSPPQLAVYRVNNNTDVDSSPDSGDESIGEFGAGPRSSESAYWIDAHSAYLGCSNAGPGDCTITINGYDATSSTRTVYQTVTQAPCPGLKNCTLALVEFAPGFKNLSGIQILAAVNDRPVTWYMDDLQLRWSNDSCAAHLERISAE